MSRHVINYSSTNFDNPWIVAKNWYIRQKVVAGWKFAYLLKCCQCISKKNEKKNFTNFEKHHTTENTYVQMWFIEQTQEMSQKQGDFWNVSQSEKSVKIPSLGIKIISLG